MAASQAADLAGAALLRELKCGCTGAFLSVKVNGDRLWQVSQMIFDHRFDAWPVQV